ncbi:hypothetical protein V2H45_14850 [Tumidithrix elongata RA019]|uniref:Uncharacterized protein n=1 Tax=Tumidithrix elongata BACA0141 TaxID=2716417 RepID=A0AAW9PUT0_9CYAN|nr:hypothetical protein [Tumidithrix elongata RA019]
MKCPTCAATEIIKNGWYRDRQRYRCKTCGYRFIESPLKKSQKNSKPAPKTVPKETADPDQIAALTQECLRLRQELETQSDRLQRDHQQNTFRLLQSLLTQYRSVQQMIRSNPNLPAQNLIALFTPLDNLMQNWGYIPIGEPWQQVPFNPQHHQGDRPDLTPGEPVYIRFIGYQVPDLSGNVVEQILVPAKVSRTLPAIATGASS